jgi:excisionase family DNA binding protein
MARYVQLGEIAEILGVDHRTVLRWVNAGKLPAIKPGGKYLVAVEDLEKYLAERSTDPKADAATYSAFREHERGEGGAVADEYPDPYSALSEVAESLAERWEDRVESDDFDLGAFNEFVHTLTQDIGPVLRRLNAQEMRSLQEQQPYSFGYPAASTGRAVMRLAQLLDPIIEAAHRKTQESDLARFREQLAAGAKSREERAGGTREAG